MINGKTEKINLLNDDSSINDEFGGHEKIADSISGFIKDEQIGKSIALIGGWGSGKSTIIEILKGKLKEISYVFVFNAWEHEGDPLRRTFLESLINFLIDNELLNKEFGEEKIEILAKRKEITDITNQYIPTKEGIKFFILLSILPIALTIISSYDKIKLIWPDTAICFLIVGLLFAFAPTIFAIYHIYKNGWDKFFTLFKEYSDKKTETKTFKTIDPTSIEFQQSFVEILDESYKSNESKKLLIVVDNLDRIGNKDSLKIWSTMKAFFEIEYKKKTKWKDKLWLLVPFDYNGIKNLWIKGSENPNSDEHSLAESFINKTFQIKFIVPPILLSKWENYFKMKFDEVFKTYFNESDGIIERHKIFRFFKLSYSIGISPTPREIKIFINDLAALYKSWGNSIAPHIQALYVILRRNDWLSDEVILKDFLDSENKFLNKINLKLEMFDPDFKESLVALYYNIVKEDAVSVLIKTRLEESLTKYNKETLDSLKQYSGVIQCADEIIEDNKSDWETENPNTIANVCLSLEHLNLKNDDSNYCWTMLEESLLKINYWTNLDENTMNGILTIIRKNPTNILLESIIRNLSLSNSLFEDKTITAEGLNEYSTKDMDDVSKNLSYILKILSFFVDNKYNQVDKFRINTNPFSYTAIIYSFAKLNNFSNMIKYLRSNINAKEILNEYEEVVKEGEFKDENYVKSVKLLFEIKNTWDFTSLIKEIGTRLKTTKLESEEVLNLVETLLIIDRK